MEALEICWRGGVKIGLRGCYLALCPAQELLHSHTYSELLTCSPFLCQKDKFWKVLRYKYAFEALVSKPQVGCWVAPAATGGEKMAWWLKTGKMCLHKWQKNLSESKHCSKYLTVSTRKEIILKGTYPQPLGKEKTPKKHIWEVQFPFLTEHLRNTDIFQLKIAQTFKCSSVGEILGGWPLKNCAYFIKKIKSTDY